MDKADTNDFSKINTGSDIRVIIQQSALPKYRIPVFKELSLRQNIKLTVVYAQSMSKELNVETTEFCAIYEPMKIYRFRKHPIYWHTAQLKYINKKYADIIVLSWDMHYLTLFPALIKAKIFGIPVILWGHGYTKNGGLWRKRVRNMAARLAKAVLVYNHGAEQEMIEDGWDVNRIFVALNSIDLLPIKRARNKWQCSPDMLKAFKQKQSIETGPVLLFVSRLTPEKKIDTLLEAASVLRNTGFPDVKVALIGDGPEKASIERRATELGISDVLRMPGSICEEEQLAPWFLTADVFCYPTNIGLSLQHAMGYGLPVVTHDNIRTHGPEIEALIHERNGLLYKYNNVDSLVLALSKIINDSNIRKELSENALETVENHFTIPLMVNGMEEAIQRCLSNNQAKMDLRVDTEI